MLGEIKLENVLIFVIVIFMLHYFIGKCSYRVGNGFSVGGQDRAMVLYDFNATEESEITIAQGNIVVVEDSSDPGWWMGFVQSNPDQKGYFPSSYVQDLTQCKNSCEQLLG